jgi:hypothetical protein
MQDNPEMVRAALMSIFALCSRAYRPDWRQTLVEEDRARGAAQTLILRTTSANRITRDIE